MKNKKEKPYLIIMLLLLCGLIFSIIEYRFLLEEKDRESRMFSSLVFYSLEKTNQEVFKNFMLFSKDTLTQEEVDILISQLKN